MLFENHHCLILVRTITVGKMPKGCRRWNGERLIEGNVLGRGGSKAAEERQNGRQGSPLWSISNYQLFLGSPVCRQVSSDSMLVTATYPYTRNSTSCTSLFSTTVASNPMSSISSAILSPVQCSPSALTKFSSYSTTPRSASKDI